MLEYIGLLVVYLTMMGINLLISAPLTALLAALTNGLAFFLKQLMKIRPTS